MDDFILPEYWCVEVIDENRELINNWKLKQTYTDNLFKNRQYNFIKNWPSITDASRTLNISATCISNCCLNKRKFFNNFKWEYNNTKNE